MPKPATTAEKPRSLPRRAWDAWAAFLEPGLGGRDPLQFTILFLAICIGCHLFIETYSDGKTAVFHPWWGPHMQKQLYTRDQKAFHESGRRTE